MLNSKILTSALSVVAVSATLMASGCATLQRDTAFDWPLDRKIIADFGQPYNSEKSEGVYFEADPGDAVRASADGVVEFARNWGSHGNIVVIAHKNSFHTIYSGVGAYTVAETERVAKGQQIALVAAAGKGEKSVLAFEIRRNGKPIDPRKLISR